MLFKNIFLFSALAFSLSACTLGPLEDPDFNNIGTTVDNVSSLTPSGTTRPTNLVIYDKTVKKIHQFDLDKMTHVRAFDVVGAEEEHYVLADLEGRYAIDLTKKGFSILRMDGSVLNPLRLPGNPRSTAYRPELGILVIYDDLNSVAIMQINSDGSVPDNKKILLGSMLLDGISISAGDVTDDGKMVVSLSDDSMAVVDIEQTLATKSWVFSRFTTNLTRISWVAPVPRQPSQVLVRTSDKIALIDVVAQTVLAEKSYTDIVSKLSKNRDPHVIIKSSTESTLIYPENGALKTRTLYRQGDNVLASFVDLQNDKWYVVDYSSASTYPRFIFNDPNAVSESREFKQYRLSDMLSLDSKTLPSKTKIHLADNFVFALFPSELGYAVRYEVQSELKSELKYFNVKHIKP